jgi:gamma-glutamylcyclotransferase (GGCT)/AIG2-like uncharacterized protein YtfP
LNNLLFIYGTLRRTSDGQIHELLDGQADFMGLARVRGKLIEGAQYPGLVKSDGEQDWVRGELYSLHDPEGSLLDVDIYEECGPDDVPQFEYKREVTTIFTDAGDAHEAWVYYFYEKEPEDE